ncbi:MAG: type II secretion system GspH family protein [Myxococcaceae bacterium]|nr:type II secretion system GspH family protein [Myxococcaceae bacterium]
MSRRGMTLIELTVAMGIIAIMIGAVVMGIGALTGTKAKSATGELAGVIRTLYDTANLTGKTCRLVFELPGLKDEDGSVKYRAECAKAAITATRDRIEELRSASKDREDKLKNPPRPKDDPYRRLDSDSAPSVQELMAREKERVESAAAFQAFDSDDVHEKELPPSVRLSVWTRHQREPAKSGLAYLYFFPQGYTERAQVTVRQGSNVWTLSLQPLTGKVSTVAEELEVPRS